ncbi:MAG TPA: anhydro-N-acetylmuramic acid kinase [Candidatus Didemnitutus sp.]|nr:anhydro-N-acetylmuramic acid kinase [Candidatus Didemnitutus sp.]
MVIAGIMTGTSVDAIDMAVCEISNKGDHHEVSLRSFETRPFSDDTRELIMRALAGNASMEELCDLPFFLARDYAAVVRERSFSEPLSGVAIHGQTLWHHPPVSTWQAASGPALAALLSVPVIHDFRSADVALGGQGAPLVPVFDAATLVHPTVDRVSLNLGGMANITILPRNASTADVWAFDTGPGNVWIDAGIRSTFGKRYDTDGHIGRAGRVIPPMFQECTSFPYYHQDPPKSTGRELFSEAEARRLITKYSHPSSPLEDVVTTMTEVTAWSVADHIRRYAPTTVEVLVSGGGSQNSFLLERIGVLLRDMGVEAAIVVHEHWNAKEAMAFAYLGWRTINGLPGNLPRVTGASRAVVLGSIAKV